MAGSSADFENAKNGAALGSVEVRGEPGDVGGDSVYAGLIVAPDPTNVARQLRRESGSWK